MRHVAIILFSILLAVQAAADDSIPSGESYFIDGIAAFEEGNYADALKNLESAYEKLPLLADYSLLYMAKSYLHVGATSDAIKKLKILYKNYPASPVIEEARGIEVMTVLQENKQDELDVLSKYVMDYPSDLEMKFVLAGLLKESGDIAGAKNLFKELFVSAGHLSSDARAELNPEDITTKDLLDRGTNLIKNRQYDEAEKTLRTALARGDRDLRKDIVEKLAQALFNQRNYSEASDLFVEIGDLYNAARSFIRSGKQEDFENAMNNLASTGDPKGARLMISYSNGLRREGKTKEALHLLKNVKKIYPAAEEEALWSTGWTYYLSGDPKKAKKTFEKLFSKYKSAKYLYWQARALEKTGKDPTSLYAKVNDDGYYGILAGLKNGMLSPPAEDAELPSPGRMEKIDILAAAGLRDYAVIELIIRAELKNDIQSLREIATKLMELKEYRRAMLVTSTLPEKMRASEILYPLAFWPKVTSAAANYDINPFLLLSLIREESRFDPEAISAVGAVGLMQLMPQTARNTARSLNLSMGGPNSLHDVDFNIKIGTHYLSELLKQFDSVPAALAAYNAGGRRVKEWLSDNNYEASDEFIEDIPFEETRNYVKRIISTYYRYMLLRAPEETADLKIL